MKTVPHVKDFMNRKFVVVDPEMRTADVARLFVKKKAQGGAVVDSDGRFLGTISSAGLMDALIDLVHDEIPPGLAKNHMDPEFPTVSEETPLMAVAELFARSGYQLWAVLVIRDGQVVGAVNRLDVIGSVIGFLAEAGPGEPNTLYISALKDIDEKPNW
jgi:predicted transcriptional regulator